MQERKRQHDAMTTKPQTTGMIMRTMPYALLASLLAGCQMLPGAGPTIPVAPSADTAGWNLSVDRRWSAVGDGLTPAHETLGIEVSGSGTGLPLLLWVDGEWSWQLPSSSGQQSFELPLADLPAGEHELLLAEQGAEVALIARDFITTQPLYVVTSIDWDSSDTADSELTWQEQLHADHPGLKLTHLVGPYTWTDPELTAQRQDQLRDWLVMMEDSFDDEIGLHIHPWCHFVETAGVTCRTEPSFVYDDGDESGYTVLSSAYTEAEYLALLERADDIFLEQGLNKPLTFRAGGWIASASVLSALADDGFVADSSANNWQLMDEWQDNNTNGLLYQWNSEHWANIGDRSQPYRPSAVDPSRPAQSGESELAILEVPDNGILADYVSADEMIQIFEANWPGGALTVPTQVSIGFHNRTQGPLFSFRQRIEGALDHFDDFQFADDAGPVIYITLKDTANVSWPI